MTTLGFDGCPCSASFVCSRQLRIRAVVAGARVDKECGLDEWNSVRSRHLLCYCPVVQCTPGSDQYKDDGPNETENQNRPCLRQIAFSSHWVDELLSHRKRGTQATHYSRPTTRQLRGAYAKAMHRLMIYREARPQVSQDQINLAVQRALQEAIGDKLAREFEKIQNQTVTGKQMAQLLRELMTVSKEAE